MKISEAPQNEREELLMQTAMIIMEKFCEMSFACHLNPDKVDEFDSITRMQVFADWAREFEDKYSGTDEYEEDFIWCIDQYAERKLKAKFGIDEVM